MGYWDYDEPMWEPSEADELFNEIKSKLIDASKDSIKKDMEDLKNQNKRLEKRVDELESKEYEVAKVEYVYCDGYKAKIPLDFRVFVADGKFYTYEILEREVSKKQLEKELGYKLNIKE